MEVKELALEDILEYENNPRKNENAVDAVAESIKEFGFKNPIIIDRNNVIISGHTRLKAARKLGLKTAPCVVADDLTEEEAKAFRLADNKVGEFSEWDYTKLQEEHAKLGMDLERFGFIESEEMDVDQFFQDAEPKEKEREKVQCPDCGEWFYIDEAEDEEDEDY